MRSFGCRAQLVLYCYAFCSLLHLNGRGQGELTVFAGFSTR